MFSYRSNDFRGEYLSGECASLAEALEGARLLKEERPERYAFADCTRYYVLARMSGEDVAFVVLPLFADNNDDSDPPDDAIPYSAAELLELESRDELFISGESECPICAEAMPGYFANRSPLGGHYFACFVCQSWIEQLPAAARAGRRLRPSSLAD